jgi:Uri superfamily endonuclease
VLLLYLCNAKRTAIGSTLQESFTGQANSSIMGTYVLALWLEVPSDILIGRLGTFQFPAGWYLYVGSAFGPGGLDARLGRHQRTFASGKRAYWHIDHLRQQAVWGGAWGSDSPHRLECTWAAALHRLPGAEIVVPGFGASDCHCRAHLVRIPSLPDEEWFANVLGATRVSVTGREIDELLKVLISGDDESREAAAVALGRFGAAVADLLARLLVSGDPDARWWAARALAEVGTDGAVPPLVGALKDPEPDVRACAALALGQIGDGAAASHLADRLADESAFVAGIAADALSMIGQAAIDALAEKLGATSPHVRLLAVRALGRIKSPGAIGPLFEMLEDPSYLVRHYAREALEALGVGMVFLAP